MTSRVPVLRRLAALAPALLIAGLLTQPASAATAAEEDRPVVGECRTLTVAEAAAASSTSAPVDCSQRHNARTIKVGTLPDALDWDDDLVKLGAAVARRCDPAHDRALGRTHRVRAGAAYRWVWFIPTKTQREAGARWYRCDLVLSGGTTYLPLPTTASPALPKGRLPDSIASCTTARGVLTTCARTHAWRVTGTFVHRARTIPSDKKLRIAAIRRCPSLTTTDSFSYARPSALDWKLGNRVITCSSKTRR
ncbi:MULTISPECIES: septum formation family protein [unclassified Nocardioides]|uniref:septum formation family protein n=1 Tax=unclassified Nocardioides TaxID=2615069 RepID=UPI00188631B7|nr:MULTISPECIES: septum formation family protein [unclassified Nocardioides]